MIQGQSESLAAAHLPLPHRTEHVNKTCSPPPQVNTTSWNTSSPSSPCVRQIEELRREMSEATQIADAVRRDLKLLSTRTAALSADQPCGRCGRALAQPPPPCGLPSGT